eukprot:2791156-Lingulodinium_polyedra.AAC.1
MGCPMARAAQHQTATDARVVVIETGNVHRRSSRRRCKRTPENLRGLGRKRYPFWRAPVGGITN